MNDIKLITVEFNGKKLAFASNTEFLIQIGRNKSSYKTKLKFFGDEFTKYAMHYAGINIGNGYKKRLISYNLNKPVIDRVIS